MKDRKDTPKAADELEPSKAPTPIGQDPGTNAVEHRPDPSAAPWPDGERKYVPRSPFRSGND